MMSFNDFVQKQKLQNKATSNTKVQQVLSSLYSNDVGIFLRDGLFESDIEIVNIHPFEGWVLDKSEIFFDSYGFRPPNKLSKFIKKRNGRCSNSDCKIQGLKTKKDSYCASYCLYIIYLTKLWGIDFKSAVFNLYYQTI